MKKIIAILACAFVSVFANAQIFSGAWCVVGEDMRIEFTGTNTVSFTSESDPSVNGVGTFSFTDTHLSAELSNAGMTMQIVYRYTKVSGGLSVVTEVLEVNGQAINTNPAPISLVRCQ